LRNVMNTDQVRFGRGYQAERDDYREYRYVPGVPVGL